MTIRILIVSMLGLLALAIGANQAATHPDGKGDEGCTPGFWKNHPEAWPISTGTTLEDVFTATLLNEEAMEKFVEAIVTSLPAAPDTYDTIRLVNAGKVAPPEDEIDVLDVGRNQCAASTSLA